MQILFCLSPPKSLKMGSEISKGKPSQFCGSYTFLENICGTKTYFLYLLSVRLVFIYYSLNLCSSSCSVIQSC